MSMRTGREVSDAKVNKEKSPEKIEEIKD